MKACVEAHSKVHELAMKFIKSEIDTQDEQNSEEVPDKVDFLTSLMHVLRKTKQVTRNVVDMHSAGVETVST